MVKVAVVGVGNISVEHIQAYIKHPDVEIVAFCDINETQLTKRADEFGIARRFTDIDTMLSEVPEIDAVSICTWNAAHAECAIKSLDAKKHVLSEKPMAVTLEQAEAMHEAAVRNNKILMIGFVRRFGNDTKVLQDFINDDFFGDMYYAKAEYIRRHGNPGGWFSDSERSGGGPLIDLGVHVIDLVRYLMGKPKVTSVYGATFKKLASREALHDKPAYVSVSKTDHDTNDVEDLASALIRFDNGAVLSVETSFSLNVKEDRGTIQLFGDKGGASLNPEIELYTDMNGYMTNITFDHDTALNFSGLFEGEINHFIDVVQGKAECLAPSEDGVEMMRILEAIYKSAKLEHEVVLDK